MLSIIVAAYFYIFLIRLTKKQSLWKGVLFIPSMALFPGICALAQLFIWKMTPPLSSALLVRGHYWGDSIFPLIKRWHAWLSTPHPESPSGGCAVTCHVCHFHSSLIPSPQDSQICLPHRGAVYLLPGCLPAPGLPLFCRLGLSGTQLLTSAWEAEPGSGYAWQQLQRQTLISILGLFRLWLSWGTCLRKAHQFSFE